MKLNKILTLAMFLPRFFFITKEAGVFVSRIFIDEILERFSLEISKFEFYPLHKCIIVFKASLLFSSKNLQKGSHILAKLHNFLQFCQSNTFSS